VVARVSTYAFPPERLAEIGEEVRAAVHADRGRYDARILAAFLGVHRVSGRAVAVTVASDDDALRATPAEPRNAEPAKVAYYDVEQTYVADGDAFDASKTPRLHLSAGTAWHAPDEDPLVFAAFALEPRTSEGTLLVAFAEWPAWTERSGRNDEVYDLEYLMVRHGAPVP
jgi:hypothetical protein